MTSIGDLLCRTEHLLQKYEKYDAPLTAHPGTSTEPGSFDDNVRRIESEIRDLERQAEEVSELKNRATVAAKNAEIRRAKNALLQTRLPELQKTIRKGKNVTPVLMSERQRILEALADAIQAIPDGIRVVAPNRRSDASCSRPSAVTRLEGPGTVRPEEYQHTDETRQLETEWEESKKRQDEALNRIERGVGVLGNLARDMRQEVEIQEPVLETMEEQLDRVKGEIKTRNQQMRGVLDKMGRRTNICFDMTLIVILLALAAYIYSLLT